MRVARPVGESRQYDCCRSAHGRRPRVIAGFAEAYTSQASQICQAHNGPARRRSSRAPRSRCTRSSTGGRQTVGCDIFASTSRCFCDSISSAQTLTSATHCRMSGRCVSLLWLATSSSVCRRSGKLSANVPTGKAPETLRPKSADELHIRFPPTSSHLPSNAWYQPRPKAVGCMPWLEGPCPCSPRSA